MSDTAAAAADSDDSVWHVDAIAVVMQARLFFLFGIRAVWLHGKCYIWHCLLYTSDAADE